MQGTRIALTDEGEGWFAGVAARTLRGEIEGTVPDARGAATWCVVRLDTALEVQERGHATASGFRLVRYERLLVRPRHAGAALTSYAAVSMHVSLLRNGADPTEHARTVLAPDVWAACTVDA